MPLPPLRNIDAVPVEHEGQTLVCLLDPEGYAGEQLALSPPAFYIASLLDGANDVSDIQYAFLNQFGQVPAAEQIRDIVDALDGAGFLITPRFQAMRARVESDFRNATVRPAHMAGGTYPLDPEELRAFLDEQFTREGGPGERPPSNGSAHEVAVRCLVSPHIDYQRGGHSYAHGYLRLARGPTPEVILVFGVAHNGPPVPFVLTRKDFETPLGTVHTDLAFVEALESACAWDPYQYEILHRTEHSIELQVVMLAHLFGSAVKIVPILCGPFRGYSERENGVAPQVDAFLDRCRDLIAGSDRRVSVIAGADLAHVGQRFGDDFEIDDRVIQRVEARDREDLAYAASLDPQGFYRSVMKDDNERRVCGINCIYAALRSVEGIANPGQVLHYGHGADPAGGIVTFADVVFM
ncbi:MAG: AmmeMemoRadiSam system protein B [FCB group bacterium]|jgi:AmmeMemoRadiSam system protein B|nr:AmmeMemoRadiSam system protein B [FCB group bacterium]